MTDAHTGSAAPLAHGIGTPYQDFEIGLARTEVCGTPVRVGFAYRITFWYRASFLVHPRFYVYRPAVGWKRWFTAAAVPGSVGWRQASLVTPNVIADATALSVVVWSEADGNVSLDDLTSTELAARPPGPLPRFRALFPQTPTIMVNEYSHWNAHHADALRSNVWDMTSGSLFAIDGLGYSGRVDTGPVNAHSTGHTNSAIFRLHTKSFAYRNVAVDLGLKLVRYSSTTRTPPRDWDGVNLFLRYQSEYSLYAVAVNRRDGGVTIKKKCPGGPSNGGTYYTLGERRGVPLARGTWIQVGASVRNTAGGVTITVSRGGSTLVTALDRGVGCRAITDSGAVGVRGDNTEFYFRDFVVTAPLTR